MSRPLVVLSLVTVVVLVVLVGQASAGRPGDANGDGMVDMTDYTAWFNNYGKTGATLADGDFDGNGAVDMGDYAMWFNNYGVGGAESKMCNIKVVTDANPDYSDMDSMIRSITGNWALTSQKGWAMFYWNHIARRQTTPMKLHGIELTDPIRQFNDYGYTMCSTIAGTNCGIFGYMGLPIKFWDINDHTVMEVMYEDGLYHMHDNSMSALYSKCDGSALAEVMEIGDVLSCPLAPVGTAGHIAKYHCLYGTSPLGYLTGADTPRTLQSEGACFRHNGVPTWRTYYNAWDWGHRYILNLRQHETYLKVSRTLGNTIDYYVPNPPPSGPDPEAVNTRYHIRGNGQWIFTPALNTAGLASDAISSTGMSIMSSGTGLQPSAVNQTGQVIYKIEGANVITSVKIEGTFKRATSGDVNTIDVSVNNGLTWTNVWTNASTGTALQTINITSQVNNYYEVLVRISLKGQTNVTNAQLTTLQLTTITMLNSKTQPKLRLGRNTVYVDKGEQSGSIVYWPEMQNFGYRTYSVAEGNVTSGTALGYQANAWAVNADQDAYITFRMDTPGDMNRLVYGGRLYNRGAEPGAAHIDFLHSFDNGATWTQTYTLTSLSQPWDVIHYETVTDIPPHARSVLVKYRWNSQYRAGRNVCGLYAARMEADYWPGDSISRLMEVKFTWKERLSASNYNFTTRSHTQLVPSLPYSYVINVGGVDHPVTDSMQVNVQGAAGPVTYGYSDGTDVGGTKFQDRLVTIGTILSVNKPYTFDKATRTNWGANDSTGKRLTDNIVGSSYTGGGTYALGPMWQASDAPVTISLDLGSAQQCGAFRIHTFGYPWWDAMKGQFTDTAEVLTSTDNVNFTSRGFFNLKLLWKDIPVNYMWTDEEAFCAHNFEMILPSQVLARYVRFKLTPTRSMSVSEIQVLSGISYAPFDLKLAPPPAFAGGGAGGGAAPGVAAPQAPAVKKPAGPGRSVTPALIRKNGK